MTENNGWGPGRSGRLKRHRELTRELIAEYVSKEAAEPVGAENVQILMFSRKPAKTKKTMFNWDAIAYVLVQLHGQTEPDVSMYRLVYSSDRKSIWIGEFCPSRNGNIPFRK